MPDISDAMGDLMCYICLGGCVVCGLAVPGVVLLALGGLDLSSSKNSVAGTALLGVVALQVSLAVSGTVYCIYGERFGAWSAGDGPRQSSCGVVAAVGWWWIAGGVRWAARGGAGAT